MKKILLIFLLAQSTYTFAFQLNEKSKFSYIEVITDCTQVYDDGIFRNIFSKFQVYDKNGEKVLEVGSSYDKPAIIKLESGEYKLIKTNCGKVIEKKILIESNNLKVIF